MKPTIFLFNLKNNQKFKHFFDFNEYEKQKNIPILHSSFKNFTSINPNFQQKIKCSYLLINENIKSNPLTLVSSSKTIKFLNSKASTLQKTYIFQLETSNNNLQHLDNEQKKEIQLLKQIINDQNMKLDQHIKIDTENHRIYQLFFQTLKAFHHSLQDFENLIKTCNRIMPKTASNVLQLHKTQFSKAYQSFDEINAKVFPISLNEFLNIHPIRKEQLSIYNSLIGSFNAKEQFLYFYFNYPTIFKEDKFNSIFNLAINKNTTLFKAYQDTLNINNNIENLSFMPTFLIPFFIFERFMYFLIYSNLFLYLFNKIFKQKRNIFLDEEINFIYFLCSIIFFFCYYIYIISFNII